MHKKVFRPLRSEEIRKTERINLLLKYFLVN